MVRCVHGVIVCVYSALLACACFVSPGSLSFIDDENSDLCEIRPTQRVEEWIERRWVPERVALQL